MKKNDNISQPAIKDTYLLNHISKRALQYNDIHDKVNSWYQLDSTTFRFHALKCMNYHNKSVTIDTSLDIGNTPLMHGFNQCFSRYDLYNTIVNHFPWHHNCSAKLYKWDTMEMTTATDCVVDGYNYVV